MIRHMLLPAVLLLGAGAAMAQDAPPPGGKEVSIPFISHGNVRTFESTRSGDGVYIQNQRRDWYFARFYSRCNALPFAIRVGFKSFGGGGTLERGDTVIAEHERCRISSIVRSGPPPKKAKKPRRHH